MSCLVTKFKSRINNTLLNKMNEMKNNGTYYAMSQEHPDWDEAEMVKEYTERKLQREEETRAMRKRYDGR